MSKKRTSPESSNDDNEASDSVFQQQHTAKRSKLTSFNDTTLHDLPIEMLEFILVKAIAMEVKGMKLAKSVWKEKADLVISRLRTVCSQWSSILTTNSFRTKLHRALEANAQEKICLEILHHAPVQLGVYYLTTIKDDIFVLSRLPGGDYFIFVYDRNNMAKVKMVIPLLGIHPRGLTACSVSNSVYTQSTKWNQVNNEWECRSVLRITKDEQLCHSDILPFISDLRMPILSISASGNGGLIFLSIPENKPNSTVVSIYNAYATLQHEIVLSLDIRSFTGDDRVIPKSNGNLILVSANFQTKTNLTEIDMNGRIIRQYQSPLCEFSCVKCADVNGRILICYVYSRMELLDSEFNLLDFTGPPVNISHETCYNSERNEVVGISQSGILNICHFAEQ